MGTAWFMQPDLQLIATYGRDIHVREGFKANNQVNLLIMHLFIFLTFAQFKTLARSRLQAKTTTYIVFLKTFKRHAFSYC